MRTQSVKCLDYAVKTACMQYWSLTHILLWNIVSHARNTAYSTTPSTKYTLRHWLISISKRPRSTVQYVECTYCTVCRVYVLYCFACKANSILRVFTNSTICMQSSDPKSVYGNLRYVCTVYLNTYYIQYCM